MILRPGLLAILLLVAPLGCGNRAAAPAGNAGTEVRTPFAPARIALHPLTRVDRDERGAPMIIAYLDVRDAWDDPAKAVGALQVLLYRPTGPLASVDEQHLTWDVDLSDLANNSRLYDPVTHMYRLPLLDAPAWIAPEAGRDQPRLRLRIVLDTLGPKAEPRRLQDDLLIGH